MEFFKITTVKAMMYQESGKDDDVHILQEARVSLVCPIGRKKMTWPCRASSCLHLDSFDAKAYFMIQNTRPFRDFKCPVCNAVVKFSSLKLDEYAFHHFCIVENIRGF